MKKYLIRSTVVWFIFFNSSSASAQMPLYDALKLSKYLNNDGDLKSTQDTVYFILDNYFEPERKNTIHEIDSMVRKGPDKFLVLSGSARSQSDGNKSGSVFSGIGKAAGGLNVTNFADGLAKFLIERAKQELSIAFFRQFQETLESNKYRHLRTLFSNTTSLLKTIDKDIYKFSAYIQALRDAFIKDLNNLFDTVPGAIKDGLLNDAFNKASPAYLKELFIYAIQITKGIKNGKHPGEIIENFNLITPDTTKTGLTDINAVIQITKLFSTSLKTLSGNEKQYWASGDSIRLLLADSNVFRIYLGLIYQKAAGIKFSNGISFQDQMLIAVKKITPYEDLIRNNIDKFTAIEEAIDDFKDKKKNEISYSDYYNLFKSVTEMLKINEDIEKLPGLNISFPQRYLTFINLAENSNEFFLDINLKKYSSGVMRLVTVLDTVLKAAYDKFVPTKTDTLATYAKLREAIVKYGTFLASVAEAQSSDEVKAAIEAAVLPVGSSSVKRETYFNIALNSFIGPFAGQEYLPKLKEKQWASVAGVTAPVGVAFSWGKIKGKDLVHKKSGKKVGGKSVSIFIPVIDVGSFATFRLSDDSSNVSSEVKLKNIISPGLYVYYGFGKCPISIGAGAQLGPQLREVNAKNINIDKNYYIRFGLNLVVDIPFFNLYTRNN